MFDRKIILPIILMLIFGMIISACAPGVTAGTSAQMTTSTQVAETPVHNLSETLETVQTEEIAEETLPTQQEKLTEDEPLVVEAADLPVPTSKPPLGENDWQTLPVIPEVSDRAREIYWQGLATGTFPDRFSKIGDCQNITTYFLAIYDDPQLYTLGSEYDYLKETVDHFQGSWSRESIAVKNGFNVASVFNPWYNNKDLCDKNESPVDCELRVHQPSIVLISMETWWNTDTSKYEGYLRMIVDSVIAHGAVPILSTKADNVEGNQSINQAIARVAYEYDLPLWNFWASVQDLPRKGLEADGFHITHGLNDFSDPANLKAAWPMRNLTALQVIDAVWHELNEKPVE